MLNNFSFEYPYVLLVILLFILCSIFCKAKSPSYFFPHLTIFKQNESTFNLLIPILKYSTIIFALVALASPVLVSHTQQIKKDGINIVLSLDTSGSMKAIGFNRDDLEQNRWQAVSSIVQDFITKRTNDNIGLVVFGTSVMTASPLSFDKEAQKEIINYLDIGIVGDRTAMIDSLASSIKMLKDKQSKSNIIVLLTDGEDTISKIPLSVILRLATKHNIKIYTIGIGESNHIVLNKIATQTNAKAFRTKSKAGLEKIYEEIDTLEKSKIDNNQLILKEYLFFYPLFIATLSLIGYIFLRNKE